MTSIFNKLLTAPQSRYRQGALNNAAEIDMSHNLHCTKAEEIQQCFPFLDPFIFFIPPPVEKICLRHTHLSWHIQRISKLLLHLFKINLWCHFLRTVMMFTFPYLTDWDYFVCKSITAAKCIYNSLNGLVKVELWHTSCPADLNAGDFTFLLHAQDCTGFFFPVATQSRLEMDVCGKVMTISQSHQKWWDENKAGRL